MKIPCLAIAMMFTALTVLPVQALTHKYPCDELIFDSVTERGDKRVQLCKSGNKINYNFGLVNGKSELDTLFSTMSTVLHTSQYSPNPDPAVELFRGDYSYTIFTDVLIVSRGEIQLSVIQLRKPIYNNLLEALLTFGVPTTKRNFTFSHIKDIENVTRHEPV